MSRFAEFINEAHIGNKMVFRATALKGTPGEGKRQYVYYRKPDGTYFKLAGYQARTGNAIVKDNMTEEECETLIKAFMNTVGDRYKVEDFRKD